MSSLLNNSNRHCTRIGFFNHETKIPFKATTEPAADAELFKIGMDVSGSMGHSDKHEKAKIIVATLVKGTNAEGEFEVPEPSGGTCMTDCAAELNRECPMSLTVIIGDGDERGLDGEIAIGLDEATGEEIKVTVHKSQAHTKEYKSNVAKHLVYAHNAKVLYVGLGDEAQDTAEAMAAAGGVSVSIRTSMNRSEVVGAIMGGVRAVRAPRAERPAAPILHTSPEVESILAGLSAADVAGIEQTAGRIHICSADDATKEQVIEAIDLAISNCKNPVKEENKPLARAMILFFGKVQQGAMEAIPGATLLGQHCGLFKEPYHSDLRKCVNQSLSKLCPKGGAKIFSTAGNTPDGGVEMQIDGRTLKFAKGCMKYVCHIKPAILDELAADTTWAAEMTAFEKTTNASPKKRAREGAQEEQPARNSPGASSADDAAPVDEGAAAVSAAEAATEAVVAA